MQGLDVVTRSSYIQNALDLPDVVISIVVEYGKLDLQWTSIVKPPNHDLVGIVDGKVYTTSICSGCYSLYENGNMIQCPLLDIIQDVQPLTTNTLFIRCDDEVIMVYDLKTHTYEMPPNVDAAIVYQETMYTTQKDTPGIWRWDGEESTQLFAEYGKLKFRMRAKKLYVIDEELNAYLYENKSLTKVDYPRGYSWGNTFYSINAFGISTSGKSILKLEFVHNYDIDDYLVFFHNHELTKYVVDIRTGLVTTFEDPNLYWVFQNQLYTISHA